jgi:hypothetical protein
MVNMTNEEIAVRLTEHDQRGKSNTHRIDELEKNQEVLHRLVTAVEVLVTKQTNMAEKVDKIDNKVSKLEAVPSDRWKNFVGYVVSAAVSAIITLLVHKFV